MAALAALPAAGPGCSPCLLLRLLLLSLQLPLQLQPASCTAEPATPAPGRSAGSRQWSLSCGHLPAAAAAAAAAAKEHVRAEPTCTLQLTTCFQQPLEDPLLASCGLVW
jgi:hypothetical protein